ncbi:hypothetical protein [Bradyrhizobium sp. 44]|nr:hypothetical protein [Bradyrhizobium sp. 44]
MSAPQVQDPPLWPWIVLIIGFGALGIGAIFVVSWVMVSVLMQ